MFLAHNSFVDKRSNCPLPPTHPSINTHQDVYLAITVLFRSAKNPSLEYASIKYRVDQVRSINQSSYWNATSNGNIVSRIVEAQSPVVAEGEMSVNFSSKADLKEKDSNERLVVFLGLFFAHLVMEADGSINKLREIFGSVTKALEQTQMGMENISSFAEEVTMEDGYLARVARFFI